MKVLFVCTGNICRSPLAEGILREKFLKYHIRGEVDSAGFESFHVGDPPDDRARKIARQNGIDISGHRARLVRVSDFDRFDHIYAMDAYHYQSLMKLARNEEDRKKVNFVMNVVFPGKNIPVQDPYYDGYSAFETVYRQLDEACEKIGKDAAAVQSHRE
jgi:protein-tyrosine phosphatase